MRFLIPLSLIVLLAVSTLAQNNDDNLEHRIAGGIGEGAQKAADGITYARDETGHLINAAGQKINEAGEVVGEAAENMKDDLSRKADSASNYVGQKLENAGRDLQGKETYNSASGLSVAATLLTFMIVFILV